MKTTRTTMLILALTLLTAGVAYAQGGGWTVQPSSTTQALYGVSFSDPNTWVAVGDGGLILRSNDAGATWAPVSSPVGDQLRAVSFQGNIGIAVGIAGRVVRSTDSGLTWVQAPRPTTRNLYSVSVGSSYAVLAGEEGTIFLSTDDGVTWSQRGAGTASVLFGVSISGTTAVGVGGQATVVMSSNSGEGWGFTVLGAPTQLFFYGTSFASSTTGWAVGAYTATGSIIVKSIQSGFVWTTQTSPTTNTLFGVSFASLDTGTAVGFNGTIVHTTNGGTDWTIQQSGTSRTLTAVSFVDARQGIAVGDSGTILRTVTGGITTVGEDPSPARPRDYVLEQNYPNPFNPVTVISFRAPSRGNVSLKIYDITGREVATLVDGFLESGTHRYQFDASGLASGVYFYRLEAGRFVDTKRLLVLK